MMCPPPSNRNGLNHSGGGEEQCPATTTAAARTTTNSDLAMSKCLLIQRTIPLLLIGTMALVFTLVSAYTCNFLKIIEDGRVPVFMGIWKIEGTLVGRDQGFINNNIANEPYLDNVNECISWTDTYLYHDTPMRAAKSFTVLGTVAGCLTWVLLVYQLLMKLVFQGRSIQMLCASEFFLAWVGSFGCLFSAFLSALFFRITDHEFCSREPLSCRWAAGSYLAVGAAILWIITSIGIAREFDLFSSQTGQQRQDLSGDDVLESQRNSGNIAGVPSRRLANDSSANNIHRRPPAKRGAKTGEQAQKPRPSRNEANRGESHTLSGRLSSTNRVETVENKIPIFQKDNSKRRGNNYEATLLQENHSAEQDTSRDKERDPSLTPNHTTNDAIESTQPTEKAKEKTSTSHLGTPLVSTAEDENGNRIKTTLYQYVDEQGDRVVERIIERLPPESEDEESEASARTQI